MGRIIGLFVFFLFIAGFEVYIFDGMKGIFNHSSLFLWFYWGSIIIFLFGFLKALTQFSTLNRGFWGNFIIGLALSLFVSKLFFGIGMFLQDSIRLIIGLGTSVFNIFKSDISNIFILPPRNTIANYIALSLGAIPFFSMLYGITRGKYQYTVNRVKLKIENLPEAFIGFTIAQISDIHSGTFDSIHQVEKGITMLNDQKADLVVFTGDLINFHKDEIDPYIESFSKISAPYGKYSILGNHDYYGIQNVLRAEQHNYFNEFSKKHDQIGFKLLRNEHLKIHKNEKSINLIGVENWGIGGFPKTGDLDKALIGIQKENVNILLSHDPSHWDHVVLPHEQKIDLTLSGHTHGMQFGINLSWLKWSPIQYRYKKWMGLYKTNDQYLYVNRGFGFLGFPGRVFMWPEITVFELQKA